MSKTEQLALWLKKSIIAQNLTYAKIEETSGVSRNVITNIVNNRTNIIVVDFFEICEAAKIDGLEGLREAGII